MSSLVASPALRALVATATDAAPDGGLVDTLTGFLMLGLAVGIVAALLIAISRRRDLTVSIEQALVAPMAVCSVGAAIVNLWIAFAAFAPWTPPSIVTLLVAAFQAEWAFAVTRRQLRSALLTVGLVVNAGALAILLWSRVAGVASHHCTKGVNAGARNASSTASIRSARSGCPAPASCSRHAGCQTTVVVT